MRLIDAIPALPVKDIGQSVALHADRLEFAVVHQESGFAILRRDDVEIHLWAATDESWRSRSASPAVVSSAESFIAGPGNHIELRLHSP